MIQVINNCLGPHIVQLPHSNGGKVIGEILVLQPGLNYVDGEKLKTARKNQGFEQLFKTKIKPSKAKEADPAKFGKPMLELGREMDDANPFKTAKGDELSVEEAEGIIARVEDADVIANWKLGAKAHSPISKALETRFKELQGSEQAA